MKLPARIMKILEVEDRVQMNDLIEITQGKKTAVKQAVHRLIVAKDVLIIGKRGQKAFYTLNRFPKKGYGCYPALGGLPFKNCRRNCIKCPNYLPHKENKK